MPEELLLDLSPDLEVLEDLFSGKLSPEQARFLLLGLEGDPNA